MTKLNEKGFMMAEVVIVSTIILGTLVGLYSIFSKMYVVYTERSYYYNVDAVYALRTIYKDLINNDKMVSLINDLGEGTEDIKTYVKIIDSGNCGYSYMDSSFCEAIKNTYGISKVFFARYDENTFTNVNIGDNEYNNLFNDYKDDVIGDYLKYLESSMDFNEEFSYMFIIELEDNGYRYYGNYRIR